MKEQRKWLRFCYYKPYQYGDDEDEKDERYLGKWIYSVAAIRSDGYCVGKFVYSESKLTDEKEIIECRETLRWLMEQSIDEIFPSSIKPFPNADSVNKGRIFMEGSAWEEESDGTVEELG